MDALVVSEQHLFVACQWSNLGKYHACQLEGAARPCLCCSTFTGQGRTGDAAGGPGGVVQIRPDESTPQGLPSTPPASQCSTTGTWSGQRGVQVAVQRQVHREREPLPGAGASCMPSPVNATGWGVRDLPGTRRARPGPGGRGRVAAEVQPVPRRPARPQDRWLLDLK